MTRTRRLGLSLGVFFLVGLAGAGLAGAGMVGAPESKPETDEQGFFDSRRMSVGAEGDWVLDRDLVVSGGINAETESSRSYAARLGYRVWGPLEAYALLGAADLELKVTDAATLEQITEEFDSGFLYGGGLGADFSLPQEWWNLLLRLDGQFVQWKSDLDRWSGSVNGTFAGTSGDIRARAYHAAATLGRAFGEGDWKFTPYVGGRWSQFTAEENNLDIDATPGDDLSESGWRADDHVGAIIGAAVQIGDRWQVNIEGRFADETAVSARGRFRF